MYRIHLKCSGIVVRLQSKRSPLFEVRFYSENAWVCAKWQWNARDCVTGLHDRRSRGQIRNLLHCVDESWWNMPFKETQHGGGVADDAVAMLLLWLHYDVTQFEYVLWRHTMHEWVMNIHYQTWIAQGRFTNIVLTPSKQWGVCDKLSRRMHPNSMNA